MEDEKRLEELEQEEPMDCEDRAGYVARKAMITQEILSMIPSFTNDTIRNACNIVYELVRDQVCTNVDDDAIWNGVFKGTFPVSRATADRINREIDEEPNKA